MDIWKHIRSHPLFKHKNLHSFRLLYKVNITLEQKKTQLVEWFYNVPSISDDLSAFSVNSLLIAQLLWMDNT